MSWNSLVYGRLCIILVLTVSISTRLKKFGMTAKEWRDANPNLKGNIRDYADISQLLVLANLESYNAILIEQGMEQVKRIELLRQTAINQLNTIAGLETPLTGVQDVLIE